jgi:hypothetical protein
MAATLGCGGSPATPGAARTESWVHLEPGLELGVFGSPHPTERGDGLINVLRIDPGRFELRLLVASAFDTRPRTAREWCHEHGLVAAINASMYQEDHLTAVSLMRSRDHVNNPRLTRDRTVLAFDRRTDDVPPVKIIDLECDDFEEWSEVYGSFVQSIRMLSCNGENVWEPQARKWSTAAIGIDGDGRVLFVHVRTPFAMHDLIDALVALPLALRSLMYAEGGPEAQLYLRSGEREYEFVGGFESATSDAADNQQAWAVPNVIAVARRESP